MKKIECVNILGTKITALDYPTAVRLIDDQVKRKSSFVCASDTHLLMESYNDKKLQKGINKSLMTTTDGMPLVWMASNILKKKVNRVYGPDLMLKVCRLAQNRKLKIFLLGGALGQGQVLAKRLMGLFPGLNIVGIEEASARPISEKDNSTIIYKIKNLKPDIIFVGLGCPHQEKWMIRNYGKFNRGVFIGVGAAFDFISGYVRQAPKWVQKSGLEWMFRLIQDPKRLWKRYLFTNIQFIFEVLRKRKTFYKMDTI